MVTLGVSFVHFRESPPADPVLHLSVPIPGNAPTVFLALSPDGRRLVLDLFRDGKSQLWLRSLDSPQLQSLPGTDTARGPFWSPDGKSIGFFADGKLKTVPATGGPPQSLCDGTGVGAAGTWNREGMILISTSGVGEPIRRVNAAGGACVAVTAPEADSRHLFPKFLPDGKHFVYLVRGGQESKRGLYLAALDNPAPRRILADDSSAIFAPSNLGKKYGYLLFLRGSDLMAQPFNAENFQMAADVFPVALDASNNLNVELAAAVSDHGILAYESNLTLASQLTWLDRSGKELGKVGGIEEERAVALSPDGNSMATVRRNQGIWLYDVPRGEETRFGSPTLSGNAPVWSPDGKWIAFGAGKGIYVEDASSGSKEELVLENENDKLPSDWSRDGRYLIYTETDPKGQGDIWYLPDPLSKSGDRKPVNFQRTDAVETQGQLSPDGRWLDYLSDESGEFQVYVRPFPSGPGRWKVSASGVVAREPRWRRDGRELFYLEVRLPTIRVMAASVKPSSGGEFHSSVAQPLFGFHGLTVVPTFNNFLYAPSADGQRFLVHVQPSDAEATVNVITNWEKAALGNK